LLLGIPAALKVIASSKGRAVAFRFDSGDQDAQLRAIIEGVKELGLSVWVETKDGGIMVVYIFEDSYTADKCARNEELCESLGLEPEARMYGFGGFLVSQPSLMPYNRDKVSSAYKLSQSGGVPRMKFAGATKGKRSTGGKPCIYRAIESGLILFPSLIAQEGEVIEGFAPLDPNDDRQPDPVKLAKLGTDLSPATRTIARQCEKRDLDTGASSPVSE
jgi:hypothetical protein